MSEHDNNLACDLSVGENRKPNRKEPKQISFRVSESEYEKLRSSAETLNMSVPNFVKKKAHGSRLVAPKFDKETRQSIAKDLSKLKCYSSIVVRILFKILLSLIFIGFIAILYFTHIVSVISVIICSFLYIFISILRDKIAPKKKKKKRRDGNGNN